MTTQSPILLMTLVSGMEVIARVTPAVDGSLKLTDPWRVNLRIETETKDDKQQVSFDLSVVHPFQLLGVPNPLNQIRGEQILFAFGQDTIPVPLIQKYLEVSPEPGQAQQQVEQSAPQAEQPAPAKKVPAKTPAKGRKK